MKNYISYFIVIVCLFVSGQKVYGQDSQIIEKGRESAKGDVDFTALAKYKLLHPDPLLRNVEDDDDDDIPHPVNSPISDTTLMKRKVPAPVVIPMPFLPVSPGPTDSFESTIDPGTTIPPDTHGAVDSNYCVTTINTTFKIQSKTGTGVSSASLNSFFSSVNPANGTFDPRTHYDPYANRWIIVCVSGANNVSDSTSILIAVSKTSNPTGAWWLYRVRAFTAHTYWLDFPDVGFNGKWLTVTGNLFQNSPGTGYGGAKIFAFDKAALYAGTGAPYTAFTQSGDFTICPSINYDASNPNMWGVESWNGTVGAVRLWKITGAVGSESMSSVGFPISPLSWSSTSNTFSGTSGADFGPQTGTSNLVQTNDDRIDQMVFMNGTLWFSHTVFLPYSASANPTRASVQWWQIDTTGTPIQTGTIDDATNTNFYAFPTLAVNIYNDLLIGCARMSSGIHPSAAYALRLHTDPTDSIRPAFTYRLGLNTYYKTFSGTKNRWGDYSAAAIDPINQRDFWTIQEASANPSNTWDTYWAHVLMPAPITGTTSVCAGSTTTLSDAASAGAWTSSATTIATVGSSTGVVTGVSAGTATISYTIANGLYAVTTYTVNAAPTAITGTATMCVGLTTPLSDAVSGGVWLSSSTSVATVSTSGLVTGVSAGTSTISYTIGGICSATRTVTVNSSPSAISGTLTVCPGLTTALSDGGGGTWTSGTTTIATVGSGSGIVTGVSAGTSVITYSLGAGCNATATVTVIAAPSAIAGTLSVCAGLTTGLSDLTGGGTWTSTNTTVATIGSGTGLVTGATAGTSTITYTVTSTGCIATAVVTVNALPGAIAGTKTVCVGLTTGLSDLTGGGTWTSGSTTVATVGSGTGVVTGASAGTSTITYTITATGCTVTTIVTVNALPAAIAGTLSVCAGSTTGLSDLTVGGTWTSGTTTIATVVSGTGVVTGVSAGTSGITYTVTATGCTALAVVTVNPSPGAITGTTSVCIGSSSPLSDAPAGGTWTSSNTSAATVGSSSGLVSGVSAGTSVITYKLPAGCLVTTTVTVNSLPSPITGATGICLGSTSSLTDAGGGTWTSSATAVATVGSGTGVVSSVSLGTSTITYTLGVGCTTTTIVTVNPLPSAIAGTISVCAGLTTGLSDLTTGGTWASGTTTVATVGSGSGLVTGVSAGTSAITYTVTATGCTAVAVVTVNALPNAIAGTKSVCMGLTTGLSDLTAGGTWTSGTTSVATVVSGTGVVTGVTPGTSTITYTITATGCTATTIVTVNPLPTAISGTLTVCAGLTTTLSDAGGGAWSSGTTTVATVVPGTGVVTGVSAGTSVITYTLGTGCTATAVVTVNPLPSAISGALSVCVGLTTPLSDAGGGTWASSTTTVATVGSGSGLVTAGIAGTSTITYTLATGCIITAVASVNPLPTAITGTTNVCVGLTTTLSDAGGGTWSSSNTSVATAGIGTGIVTGVSAGTATITYTAGIGCATNTTVTVNPLPGAITGVATVCAGLITSLTDAGGGTWSSSVTTIATVGSGTGIVTGVLGGTSVITYTLANGCYSVNVVTVNPLPAPITGSSQVCAGLTTPLSDATGGGTWTSSNTSVATVVSGTGVVTGVAPGTTTITYTLTATGCITTLTFTVNLVPTTISGVTNVCVGASTGLSDATGGGAWSSSATTIATVGSGSGLVTGVSAGTASITYTLGAGCTTVSTITVNPLPSAIAGTKAVCVGLTTGLSDVTGGGTWTSGNTAVATVVLGSGLVTGVSAGTSVITYTVTATGCIATAIVTVNPLPATIAGTTNVCVGLTTALTDAGGGNWTSGTTAVATVGAGTGIVTGVLAGTSSITYTLGTGCLITTLVTVNPLPSAITGTTTICAGATTALTDAGGGTWTSGNTIVATVGSTTGIVSGSVGGSATITYTLGTGCITTTTVNINPLPSPVTGTATVCEGLTTGLFDVGGGSWTSGNTTIATVGSGSGTVTGVLAGTAAITYMLGTGCATSIAVTVYALPPAITGTNVLCEASSATLSDAAGGTWSSSNTSVATINVTTGLLSGITGGTATITYSLATGCIATTVATINPLPIAISGAAFVCAGLTTGLSDVTAGGTWTSSNTTVATIVPGTGLLSGLVAGTSDITYTLGTGCYKTITATVNPLPSAITGTFTVCPGLTASLTDAGGGSWTSSSTAAATVGAGTGIVTGVAAGTTTITYTLGTGCTTTATFTVNGLPVVAAITGANAVCAGLTISLTDATTGGAWTSGSTVTATVNTSGVVTGVTAGVVNISYSVTNVCGTTSSVYAVTVNALPVVAPIAGITNVCIAVTTGLSDATPAGVWSSSNTTVATISALGVVTGVTAGTTTISYTVTNSFGCVSRVSAIVTVNPPLTITVTPASSTSFCTGGYVTLNATTGPGFTYQWRVGGLGISGATSSGYLVNYSGSFDVVVNGPGICTSVSSPVAVTVSPAPIVVPSVTITATPDTIICLTSSPVTFTANPVNGGTLPSYKWYVNGAATAIGAVFTYSPSSGDIVKVRLTSNATCVFPDTAIGNVSMTISPLQTPSVSIKALSGDTVCVGTFATFAAVPSFGGSVPTYVWTKNGVNVSTGTSFGYIPNNGDVLVVTMTSNYPCLTTTKAVSPSLHVNVEAASVNKDSIYHTRPNIFKGQIDTFVAIATHGGASPAYQWYLNGVALPGETNATYVTVSLTDGDIVKCAVTSSDPCTSPKTGVSNSLKVHVGSDVATLGTANGLVLIPNPNKGVFTISGTLKGYTDGVVTIVMTDMLGQNVYKNAVAPQNGAINEQIVLNRSVANANYIVKVSYGDEYQVFHVVVDR